MGAGDRFEAIVLFGVPGAGKSYLGNRLQARGVARYLELEPILLQKFGELEAILARLDEVSAFVWEHYRRELKRYRDVGGLMPVFESAGVTDRALLDQLDAAHRVAYVHVDVPREVCTERVATRARGRNISNTTDAERMGQHYDLWHQKVLPKRECVLRVDGRDAGRAVDAIAAFIAG
jgi:adenylate kinase family enzyme